MKYYEKREQNTAEYIRALGHIFEEYANQDSGNVCYSVQTENGPVWVKILNLEQTPLSNIHEIIEFYNTCGSALIPKNWTLVELTDNLVMRHDWVPGKVLHSPDERREAQHSTFQKFLRLPKEEKIRVYTLILEFFVELEGQQIIVEDFYDGCIIYDFVDNQVFLCDLDHIHVSSYELKKDRQFGSRRFMAPEEFRKGAIIDQRTNVYTLGATAFVLLSNNRCEETEWQYSPNLYPIVKKAISPNQRDRFDSVKSLRDT